MESKTFSAGVMPGGLTSKHEIKLLICYIMDNIKTPINKSDIVVVLQNYGFANYFEASEAFSEMISSGNIEESPFDKDGYILTEQGKIIVKEISESLPIVVRNKALIITKSYLERAKNEEENKVIIRENNYGFDVTFIISGGPFEMLRLTLYAPNMECANTLKDNFYKNPDKIYDKILSLFTDEEF